MMDLVGANERVIDAFNQIGDAVRGVKALVRVHAEGIVHVGGHLPAAHINGLEPRLDLLDGLIAGDRAERGHIFFFM